MEWLTDLVLLFFAYAFLGWCIEVTLKYIQYHRFINRGFLTGPCLPIYGSGAALITVAVGALAPMEKGLGTTFMISFVLCGVLEYFASYFMEKRFHARWWDYSQKPMNLHGRIWIGNLLLFGLGGVLIIHVLNPVLTMILSAISFLGREITAGCLSVLFLADYVMTHFVLKLVKVGVEHSEADNTEEISREVRLLLSDRSIFYRRFADAYPDVIYRTERINARLNAIKAETEQLRRQAEERLESQKELLENKKNMIYQQLEPSRSIRTALIQDQAALIDLLYSEENATEEEKRLRRAVDENTERLKKRDLRRILASAQEET
ncbi:MAG: hypothetical protein IJ083_03155 [Clostridia bacterium]|nr:hypothetical protein [Clostridia bacterium]